MTAQDVFKMACALIAQVPEDSMDLKTFSDSWLNILLEEALPYENSIRKSQGKEILINAPIITQDNFNNEIDLDIKILKLAMPYGLASFFYRDDENEYVSGDYRIRFINALNEITPIEVIQVKDCYADSEE